MSESPFPRLDLAPKLNRPLRLWWPPDYLRLLYWALFFPQAIRWYVRRFGKPENRKQQGGPAIWQALRDDPIQWQLAVQALLAMAVITPGIAWLLQVVGVSIDWKWVTAGVAVGVAGGVGLGVAASGAVGGAIGVVGGWRAACALACALAWQAAWALTWHSAWALTWRA